MNSEDYHLTDDNFTRVMAIDFGLKRIGIALTDPLQIFAYPYKTILNDGTLWKNLSSIIKEQNVIKIILGHPLNDRGGVNYFNEEWLNFKKKLEDDFKLEVILWDERYTSSMAKEQIMSSVSKKSKRRDKSLLDMSAAAIMLKEYLEVKK